MLTLIGWTLIGSSVLAGSYPAFESVFLKDKHKRRKLIAELHKAFFHGDFFKKINNKPIYPSLLKIDQQERRQSFVFSVPKGMNPEEFTNRVYVFKQHFGQYITLEVNEQRGILQVYTKGLPSEFIYNYINIQKYMQGMKLPIVCGRNLDGETFVFDLAKHPHILISGETGSGKSSEIRSIVTTLIQTKPATQLRFVLGDLKRSEFHLFKTMKHVDGVYHTASELLPALKKIKKEMSKRGDLLDEAGVNSIYDLKEKLSSIIVCIDEVVLLKKETDIMDILEEISSIGRSLGVFIILSMQRPDAKLLDGKLKVNLTVRMGFQTADATNSKIIGTPGAEKLNTPGRMILKINSSLQEIQCPWLENDMARKLLQTFKREEVLQEPVQEDEYSTVRRLLH